MTSRPRRSRGPVPVIALSATIATIQYRAVHPFWPAIICGCWTSPDEPSISMGGAYAIGLVVTGRLWPGLRRFGGQVRWLDQATFVSSPVAVAVRTR